MASEASFTRHDTPEGIRFNITPADAPAGAMLFLKAGGGCVSLLGAVFLAVIAAAVVYTVVASPLVLILGSPTLAGVAGGLAALGAGFFVILWRMRAYAAAVRTLDVKRDKVSLVINARGIRHPGGTIPTEDVAELLLRHPHDRGGYRANIVVPEGVSGSAYNAGARMGTEIRNRSFALMIRRKSASTPEILAGGLTWHTGEALLNDIREAMT